MNHHLPSLDELKRLRTKVRNVNVEHHERFTRAERAALIVTEQIGSVGFFSIIFFWTVAWLIWNTLAPVEFRFDPYPAFVLWLFISNMLQIFLMPLLLIGQNLQGRHAEARAESDFEVNVKAEREIEAILAHLEVQHTKIEEILEKLEEKKIPTKKKTALI